MSSIGSGGGRLDVSEMLRAYEAKLAGEVTLEDVARSAEKANESGDDPAELATRTGSGIPASTAPQLDPTQSDSATLDAASTADSQQDRGQAGQDFLAQEDDSLKVAAQNLNINEKEEAGKLSAQDLLNQMSINSGIIKS